jgi:hypothetical protein
MKYFLPPATKAITSSGGLARSPYSNTVQIAASTEGGQLDLRSAVKGDPEELAVGTQVYLGYFLLVEFE